MDENNPSAVAGFVTLASAQIPLYDLPDEIWMTLTKMKVIPTTLIARLGVDNKHRRKGLGTFLLLYSLELSLRLSSDVASYAVVVDAKNEAAKLFYERHDFAPLDPSANRFPIRLFLPMASIEKLFRSQV